MPQIHPLFDETAREHAEALPWQKVASTVAGTALLVSYQITVHHLIDAETHPLATMFLGLLPFALLLAAVALGAGWRIGAVLAPAAIAALGWYWRDRLQTNFGWIYLADHVGTQCLLGFMFAHTLRRGRTPLITQFAQRVHGGVLSPKQIVYTQRATLAWTLFFALDALISLTLFAWAPLPIWSTFANLLTLPLVAAMFIGEYAVRRVALPLDPHVSLAAGARAFWQSRHAADAPGASS